MRDMHRERLTHLLANAILELWKKETGSLSSVVIEGTICITSSTGKTTVLQVADRFTGSIPEAEDDTEHSFSPPDGGRGRYHHQHQHNMMRSLSVPHCYSDHTAPPRVDCHNQAAMAAFLDNLSPASLVSPGTEHSRCSQERRSPSSLPLPGREVNNNHSENAMDVSSSSIKEEASESSSDTVNGERNVTSGTDAPTGSICAGTGYYTCTPQELNNNTIDPKYSLKFHKGRSPQCSPDRNKRRRSRERSPLGDEETGSGERKRMSLESLHVRKSPSPGSEARMGHSQPLPPTSEREVFRGVDSSRHHQRHSSESDAMDLTRKCVDDLALSPPHSYTAQVRDIIRQRVLAAQMKVTGSTHPDQEIGFRMAEHQHLQEGGKYTPKVLESLGLHRSDGEEGDVYADHPQDLRPPSRDENRRERTPPEVGGHILPAAASSTPDEPLKVVVSRKNSHATPHPLLLGSVSPILVPASSAPHLNASHSPLPSPGSGSSSASSTSSTNGHLHSILQQHRLYLPLSTVQRGGVAHSSGPNSAPPLFTHPGFSPLTLPPGGSAGARDASPSPTDLSLDSSGDSEKEVGPNGEQRVYKCEFCTKTFLFKSKYHEHLPVHTNARPFQCHLCSRTYKYKYDLRVHLRTHMGIPTKSTVCPFCNEKFDTNKRLRVHIKDAHKDKQKITEEEPPQPPRDAIPPTL